MQSNELAGLGQRLIALIIDGIILGIIGFIVNLLPGMTTTQVIGEQTITTSTGLGSIITFIIGIAYYAILFNMWNGQTVGKKLLGIRVVKVDGSPVTAVTAIIRYIGYAINTFILMLGWILAIFDSKHQGVHDKLAGTIVVKA
jgi:uncharacterized RDD family membrane protein YckC